MAHEKKARGMWRRASGAAPRPPVVPELVVTEGYEPLGAFTVGYWARVNDVPLSRLLGRSDDDALGRLLGEVIADQEGQQQFHEGWQFADAELAGEREDALLASLLDARPSAGKGGGQ